MDPFEQINEDFHNGTFKGGAGKYKMVPARDPYRLCKCSHTKPAHGSIDGSRPRCLMCSCGLFADSGEVEDPRLVPRRLEEREGGAG